VEAEAYGVVQGRAGNRGPVADPQGVFACAEPERWLAVAAVDERQRAALADVVSGEGEAAVEAWLSRQPLADAEAALVAAGVPCAEVVSPGAVDRNEQLVARGFFEPMTREVIGLHHVPSLPYRFASRGDQPWHRTPAPVLGEHNDEVLGGELGLAPEELERLRNAAVIGDRPLRT
jgi:crotonobetainyl-CoA:carnitine CoA-transferase CaiB-like acyl-CoA transferase